MIEKLDGNLVSDCRAIARRDDVIVRQDVTILRDDETGPRPAFDLRNLLTELIEEVLHSGRNGDAIGKRAPA